MKKIMNVIVDFVCELCEGFVVVYVDLVKFQSDLLFLYWIGDLCGWVVLILGGGSGYEFLYVGYIGCGMLIVVCLGEVFISLVFDQMLVVIWYMYGGQGVFLIVKNYIGDVMNFELVVEFVVVEGIEVVLVVIGDDVVVQDSIWIVGCCGVGGMVLFEKIVGVVVEVGVELVEVKQVVQIVMDGVWSMGLVLMGVIVFVVGKFNFMLVDDEIELGIGIYGELGCECQQLWFVDELVDVLFDLVMVDFDLKCGEEVIVLINGMGGIFLLELYVVYGYVVNYLVDWGVKVV